MTPAPGVTAEVRSAPANHWYGEVHIPIGCRVCIVLFAVLSAGCAYTYQPIGGLHAPAIVHPAAPNLVGQRVHVTCERRPGQPAAHSRVLCRRVSTLLVNQGASVTVDTPDAPSDGARAADLSVTLVSADVPQRTNTASWVACTATLGILPATTQSVFTVDAHVRDADGFLLTASHIEGRLVTRYGLGPWIEAALSGQRDQAGSAQLRRGAASAALSSDVYGQLSQLLVDAAAYAAVTSAPGSTP